MPFFKNNSNIVVLSLNIILVILLVVPSFAQSIPIDNDINKVKVLDKTRNLDETKVLDEMQVPDKAKFLDKAEILLKIDRALNPESFTAYKKIINIDTRGTKKEFVMFIGKSGTDKVLGTFLAPRSELGRATLRIGDNMWLYIPNVKKPLRITSLQSVIGGLFNNADIMGLDYSTEYDCIDIKEDNEKLNLELKAKTKSVAYEKLMILANKNTYLTEKIECYTSSGMLVKTLHFKKITTFEDGFTRPAVIETDSPLYKGAKSILIYDKLKSKKLSEELFSINSMSKYKDLR